MPACSQKNQGFTLVEILVAMTILSMTMLIGTQAFRFFSERWDGQLGAFNEKFISLKTQLIVQDTLSRITPYLVFDYKTMTKHVYFEGNRNGFITVSTSAVSNSDYMAVIRLRAEQNAKGMFDLYFEEWPMQEAVLISYDQSIPFNRSIMLLSNLTAIEFQYYGYKPRAQRRQFEIESGSEAELLWQNAYNGLDTDFQPEKISIRYSLNGRQSEILIDLNAATDGFYSETGNSI